MATDINDIKLVSNKTKDRLKPRQLASYREHRRELIGWMAERGKDPEHKIGYAEETVKVRAYRLDKFYRMIWTAEERYTEDITPVHADAWMEHLADRDVTDSYRASCQKAVITLFWWKSWKTSEEIE